MRAVIASTISGSITDRTQFNWEAGLGSERIGALRKGRRKSSRTLGIYYRRPPDASEQVLQTVMLSNPCGENLGADLGSDV